MDLAGVIWHFANFFAAPLGLGVIASLMAKLLWRGSLRSVSWPRLAGFACAAALAAHFIGLVLLGTDGKMLTYAAMVLATATALWWAGRPSSSKS